MKYISGDDRTARLLKAWSGAKEICTPNFFFWSAGATLEKSFEGLLRSLLYQIFQQFPNLIPLPCENQSALGPAKDGLQRLGPIAVWTEPRLRTTFQRVICQALGLCRLCIFIDGLDEIKGDPDMMISLITTIKSADVKFVLSSRPDRSYTEAFGSFAMLRLQDLTELDIREYVWERLEQWLHTESADDVSSVLNSIVLKAQGVFLWVELVVKTLIKGLENKDPIEQLQRRVELTPSGINALYAKMLSNIDVVYHPEAARLFQMALANLTRSLLNVALLLYEGFDRVPEISVQKALQWSGLTEKRIPTICAGLLEVYREDRDSAKGDGHFRYQDHYLSLPIRYTCSSATADVSFYERYVHVGFIHRTAVEFLRQSKQAQRFWKSCYQSCPSPHSTYVRALLAKVILLGFPEKPAIMDAGMEKDIETSTDSQVDDRCDDFLDKVARGFVSEIMQKVYTEERETGTAQVSLCDDVDRTLTTVFQRHQVVPPIFHWSKQWSMTPSNTKIYAGTVSWLRKSSRSSSPESFFYPARSDSRLSSTRPVDFLGHATLWSLSCYVVKMIDLKQKHLDKEYMNYLLCCSLWPLHPAQSMASSGNKMRKSLNLIADILSCGGNPNVYVEDFFSTTLWGLFVMTASRSAHLDRTAFLMTTKTFFENGADVHVKFPMADPSVFGSGHGPAGLNERPELYLRNEVSASYFIRTFMPRDMPGLTTLKGMFLAEGGRDSHRYTHVAFEKDSYRPYRISERQTDELIAALDASRDGHANQENRHGPLPERVRWTSQLEKIYQEISERIGDSDIRASSDKDATSDTDAEEEFHESVTFQTEAHVQDCQPVDG